jgi:hypothetical protein
MCHEKDPDHPTFVVLNAPSKVRPFVNGYDCVAMDPYPIGYPNCFIGMASDWPLQAQRGMYRSRAMWQVPQAFNWASCFPPGLKMPKDVHMPTREEMRSMTWQAIAGGANGLIYFSFEGAYLQGGSEEENMRRWMDVCAVVSEVKAHESMLLSKPGPDVGNVPKGMVCRTWKTDDGKVRLLACNTEQKPIEGTVRIGGESVSISLPPIGVFIGRPVAVRRGKL